jgi:CIC family chloride channel protein
MIKKALESLTKWADDQQLRQHEDKVLFILTLMIGAIVGLVVVAFILVTENLGSRMYPAGGAAWRRIVVPVIGALITGYLLLRYFPNARGSGIPQTKTALFLQAGVIRLRTVLGKFGCSSVSLATGIALGREGPSVQVGAGIASILGRQLGLSPSKAKALVPIGASAALAAAFNTPIAAVLFTLEEVMGDLHARVLGAIVMSSATSWMVLHLVLGDEPLFHVPAYQLVHPIEFLFYAALGALGGLVSVAFVKLLLGMREHFLKMPAWTTWFQPAAGGLVVGLMGWFVPSVLGVGYSHVNEALNSRLAIGAMALLVVLKLVATASCYASGNAGGIFGPSLFIGAMMGGAFGAGAHILLPDYTGSVGAYALVGMGAAFAGIIRVPMTSVIMIFEITRDYSIIVPLMIANLISYFISSRLQRKPIYESLLHQDGIHLPTTPREREETAFVNKGMRTPEKVIRCDDTIQDALTNYPPEASAWPVMDSHGLFGMITRAQLHEAAKQGRQHESIADLFASISPDIAIIGDKIPHLHPDHPLDMALRRMAQSHLNLLPVIDRSNPQQVIGVLGLRDAVDAYKQENGGEVAEGMVKKEKRAPAAVLGGIAIVIVLMIGLAGFLSYFYRSQRAERAEQFAVSASDLMKNGRYQEAIERYRGALSISHSSKDRLALATALVKANRWNEAEIYLKELVRETPDSGPVNLGLGRIAVQRGNFQNAINYYHKSIYGNWPDKSQTDRIEIRMELVRALSKAGRSTQVRAELLALMTETPEDEAVRKQVARWLLDYGMATESAQLYQEIVKKNAQDAEAYAGLGHAEFSLGNFRLAQQAYKAALRRNPADAKSAKQLGIAEQILALDPSVRGLKASEKYSRSRSLIEAVLQSLDECAAIQKKPLPDAAGEMTDAARKSLARKSRPRSYGDATESNLDLAELLWKVRVDSCGSPQAPGNVLGTLMNQLSR